MNGLLMGLGFWVVMGAEGGSFTVTCLISTRLQCIFWGLHCGKKWDCPAVFPTRICYYLEDKATATFQIMLGYQPLLIWMEM